MSDPGANVDIDDVLSSIRRLVYNGPNEDESDQFHPESDEAHGQRAASSRDVKAERLVLTPSQRIDTEASDAAAENAPAHQSVHAADAGSGKHGPGDPDIAPDTAAVSPDVAEDDDIFGYDGGEAERRRNAPAHGDVELDGMSAKCARRDTAAPSTPASGGEDEHAFAEGADEAALDWRDAGDGSADWADSGCAQEEAARPEQAKEQTAAVARYRDADVPGDAENAFVIADGAVFDEEALRDLVAEIVREELRGDMGERVTRNVRKLVRREIRRALNAQEFD